MFVLIAYVLPYYYYDYYYKLLLLYFDSGETETVRLIETRVQH